MIISKSNDGGDMQCKCGTKTTYAHASGTLEADGSQHTPERCLIVQLAKVTKERDEAIASMTQPPWQKAEAKQTKFLEGFVITDRSEPDVENEGGNIKNLKLQIEPVVAVRSPLVGSKNDDDFAATYREYMSPEFRDAERAKMLRENALTGFVEWRKANLNEKNSPTDRAFNAGVHLTRAMIIAEIDERMITRAEDDHADAVYDALKSLKDVIGREHEEAK